MDRVCVYYRPSEKINEQIAQEIENLFRVNHFGVTLVEPTSTFPTSKFHIFVIIHYSPHSLLVFREDGHYFSHRRKVIESLNELGSADGHIILFVVTVDEDSRKQIQNLTLKDLDLEGEPPFPQNCKIYLIKTESDVRRSKVDLLRYLQEHCPPSSEKKTETFFSMFAKMALSEFES